MKKRISSVALVGLIALAMFILPSLVQADVVITQQTQMDAWEMMGQKSPAKTDTIVTLMGDGKARVDRGDTSSVILNTDKGMIYMISHKNKNYTATSLKSLDNLAGQVDKMAKEKAAAGDEEAAAMADMMKSMMKIKGTVTATEETKKIKNWNCTKYDVEINMGMVSISQEMWATEDIKIDPELFLQASQAMMSQFEGYDAFLAEMKKIKGVAVQTKMNINMMGNAMTGETNILSVKDKDAPKETYALPKGYEKMEMKIPGMGGK